VSTLFSRAAARTSNTSFSFYLPPTSKYLHAAAPLADALTIAGPKGPAAIRKLRDEGFASAVLFDGVGYGGRDLPPAAVWVEEQRRAGADRELLPGVFLPWDKEDFTTASTLISSEAMVARDLGASMVIAVDARWVGKRTEELTDMLRGTGAPVAMILAAGGDPLAVRGAVRGLRWLATRVPNLSVLRCDHGAIGAVTFGAVHAAIGLTTGNRHFATSGMRPHKLADPTARLFLRNLLDWFRAGDVAGWAAAGADITCPLPGCDGHSLARFLDRDNDAVLHNLHALADFADWIIGAEPEERAATFMTECRDAAQRYGLAGFKGPEEPKPQLTGWALL